MTRRTPASVPAAGDLLWPAAALSVTALGVFRKFSHWPQIWDIRLWDETDYLGYGLLDPSWLMRQYEVGPLYGKFYHLLALATGDPSAAQLYFLGGLVVILLGLFGTALGVWAASRSVGFAILSVSLIVLSGTANIWPRISFLCLFILGVGFTAVTAARGRFAKASLLALTCFLASFVRPEYVLAFYASLALAFAWAIEAVPQHRLQASVLHTPGLAALAAIAILSILWSFPLLQGGQRAFIAFGQHYSYRAVAAHHLAIEPWLNWRTIVAQDFPGAKSLTDALLINPALVLGCFVKNAFGFVPEPWHSPRARYIPWGAAGLLAIGVALWSAQPWRRDTKHFDAGTRMNALCAAILLIPPTLSLITIFPRDHYILLEMATGMVLVGSLIRTRMAMALIRRLRVTGVVSKAIAADWLPLAIASVFALLSLPILPAPQPRLAAVDAFHAAGPMVRVLESEGGLCIYGAPICKTVLAKTVPAGVDFPRYLDSNSIDAVAVSTAMMNVVDIKENPSFQNFVATAAARGWSRHDLPPISPGGFLYLLTRDPRTTASPLTPASEP